MKTLKTCLTIFLLACGLVVAIDAARNEKIFAAENSYLIEVDRLTREVSAGLARITRVSMSSDRQIRRLEDQIHNKLNAVRAARSEPELAACQKEYFDLRSQALAIHAEKADANETELTKLVRNLDRLETAQNNSRTFGLGEGVQADDVQAQTAVAAVLRGQQNLLTMISKVSPGTRIGSQADALSIKIGVANKFFANKRNMNFDEQKRYAVDALLLVRDVKNLLRQSHDDLLQKLYYVDARHTVRQLQDLKVAVLGSVVNGSNGIGAIEAMDNEVINMQIDGSHDRFAAGQPGYHSGLNAEITFGSH
jgi:hypothetical protein